MLCSSPMSEEESMKEEEIRKIIGINARNIGFVSSSGFSFQNSHYALYDEKSLFSI